MFDSRATATEVLDRPDCDPALAAGSYRFMETVICHFGGIRMVRRFLATETAGRHAAALGGLDTLVFSGGIGENCPSIRARICEGSGFLGIELNTSRNAANTAVISMDTSPATVRVIRTDEELMIARSVCRGLGVGMTT